MHAAVTLTVIIMETKMFLAMFEKGLLTLDETL